MHLAPQGAQPLQNHIWYPQERNRHKNTLSQQTTLTAFLLSCLIVVGFWWDSGGILMGFLWDSGGIVVGFWWDSGGILVGFWWDSDGFWWDSLVF